MSADIKVSTWNLEWLTVPGAASAALPEDVIPRTDADLAALRRYAQHLDADIIGFQEVDGSTAAAQIFDPAQYNIVTIKEAVVQRVGLAVRRPLRLLSARDYGALDVDPDAPHPLRDGLDAQVLLPGGQTLRILVVHLKTGCHTATLAHPSTQACRLLSRQIGPLAAWAASRQGDGSPFMLMGDFNRVLDQRESMGDALDRAAPMMRVTAGRENPCWGGRPFIDHIFLGGAARDWLQPGSLRVQIFHEHDPSWMDRLSDHCPVSIRLSLSAPFVKSAAGIGPKKKN